MAMKKRSVKTPETPVSVDTFEEFEGAVDLVAEKQTEIEKLVRLQRAAEAKVKAAKKLLGCYMKPSEEYALANEGEIFPDAENQTRETASAVYGLKQNANPSVLLLDGYTDEDVIERIERSKRLDARLKQVFVQRSPKLARQSIIGAYKSGEVDDAMLKLLGLSVRKVKSLFVEAKAA